MQRSLGAALLAAALTLFFAGQGAAQLDPSRLPPLPEGDGVVAGKVVHPDGSARAAGSDVVLYGLAQDGSPGIAHTRAEADGSFRFEKIPTSFVFLLGGHFEGVAFYGPRLAFRDGAKTIDANLEVADRTSDASTVLRGDTTLELAWTGNALVVAETHALDNASQRVVFTKAEDRGNAQPAFTSRLPQGATDTDFGSASTGEFELAGDTVRFWGPVYPGPQQIRYAYRIPVAGNAETGESGESGASIEFTPNAPGGGGTLELRVPANTLEIEGTGLTRATDIAGEASAAGFDRYVLADAGANPLRITPPAAVSDPSRVSISRADLWLELDDTTLSVNAEMKLQVEGDAHVTAPDGGAALRFSLPRGAEISGLSPTLEALGGIPVDGGYALRGPLPPGETSVALRYKVPSARAAEGIELRFPAPTSVVNVLIADTGVVVESDRLHRRRPFQSGTRTQLHREAYHLGADEAVALRLTQIDAGGLSRNASLMLALAAMAGGALFLIAPLQRGPRIAPAEAELTHYAIRREAVYANIRDIDHDFETGKLGAEDHTRMRAELREQAIEWLRLEKQAEAQVAASPAEAALAAPPQTSASASTAASAPSLGRFCPSCGGAIQPDWAFCSHCGAGLAASQDGADEGSAA